MSSGPLKIQIKAKSMEERRAAGHCVTVPRDYEESIKGLFVDLAVIDNTTGKEAVMLEYIKNWFAPLGITPFDMDPLWGMLLVIPVLVPLHDSTPLVCITHHILQYIQVT